MEDNDNSELNNNKNFQNNNNQLNFIQYEEVTNDNLKLNFNVQQINNQQQDQQQQQKQQHQLQHNQLLKNNDSDEIKIIKTSLITETETIKSYKKINSENTFLETNFKYKRRRNNGNNDNNNNNKIKKIKKINNCKNNDDVNNDNDYNDEIKKQTYSKKFSYANYYLLVLINKFVNYMKKVCQYARCVKMLNNNCPIGYILLIIVFVSLGFTDMTEAGACWVARMNNGKCKELFSKNVSKDECCKYGQEFAYTDKEMSDVEYFFATAIGDGATCVSCLDSCDVAKCGTGKRCIIRKGRPKCVCAPICKASKDKKFKKDYHNNYNTTDNTNNNSNNSKNNSNNNNNNNNNNNSIRVIDIGQNEKLKQINFDNIVSRNRKIPISSTMIQQQQQQQQQQQNEQEKQQENNWFPIPVSLPIQSASTIHISVASSLSSPSASSSLSSSVPFSISSNNNHSIQNKKQQKRKQTEYTNTIIINNMTIINTDNRKKKNQRKSDFAKRKNQNMRRKSMLEGVIIDKDNTMDNNKNNKENDNDKKDNNENMHNNDNNSSINSGNRNFSIKSDRSSVKLTKNLETNTKNIVIIHNGPGTAIITTQQQQQQPHHSRHEFKKKRKFQKQQKLQHNNTSQNVTTTELKTTPIIFETSIKRKHRPPTINRRINQPINTVVTLQQEENFYNQMTLDEKIRNGFFSHGFPYSPDFSTGQHQMVHGRYYNPVCGSDGKTYKTECQLKKRACRRETSLTVAYRGHCQTSCKLVHCLDGLTCVEDQYGIPHCISCTISCPQDDLISDVIDPTRAVCGVDGRTYKSICDINRMICITGRSIAVAYYGPCQESANCNNIHCGQRKICLTDLITHKPRCISCSFKCPRRRRPQGQKYEDVKICGNNNHTYYSWCHMRRDSCNTEFYIDVRHVGPCHKDSFRVDEKLPHLY